jgi:hypothetical protein
LILPLPNNRLSLVATRRIVMFTTGNNHTAGFLTLAINHPTIASALNNQHITCHMDKLLFYRVQAF